MSDKKILSSLRRLIVEHTQTARLLEEELTRIQLERDKLDEKSRTVESRLREENRNTQNFHEQIIIMSRLPQRVVRLRSKLIETRKAACSVDITIRKQDELHREIEKLSKDLQEACKHPFVLSYDGCPNKGGNAPDCDTGGYPGARHCLICGFSERSQRYGEDEYKTLVPDEARLIKRDLRKREKQNPAFHTFKFLPLPRIREVFLASAGHRNVVWPEEKTGKKKKEDTAENAQEA